MREAVPWGAGVSSCSGAGEGTKRVGSVGLARPRPRMGFLGWGVLQPQAAGGVGSEMWPWGICLGSGMEWGVWGV